MADAILYMACVSTPLEASTVHVNKDMSSKKTAKQTVKVS